MESAPNFSSEEQQEVASIDGEISEPQFEEVNTTEFIEPEESDQIVEGNKSENIKKPKVIKGSGFLKGVLLGAMTLGAAGAAESYGAERPDNTTRTELRAESHEDFNDPEFQDVRHYKEAMGNVPYMIVNVLGESRDTATQAFHKKVLLRYEG